MLRGLGKTVAERTDSFALAENLERHYADFGFDFRSVDHYDGIPGAAVQEASIGAFAEAFFAADAKNRVDLNSSEWRMVLVRHPEHAIFHRTVLDAGRRSGASSTAFGDYGQLFGFLFTWRGQALGAGLELHLIRNHPGIHA